MVELKDKQPFWKNKVLYVWDDFYNCYVANHSPSHYYLMGMGLTFDEYKKMFNMDYKEVE